MAAYTKCTAAIEALLEGINVGSDTWKIALSNASAVAKTSFTAGTDDLATGNGYTAGGVTLSVTSATQSGGTYRLICADPAAWTASGGNVGPFRYAILWNATLNIPVGQWDYGSSITLNGANGDTFAVDLDQTNGVFFGA